MIARRTHLETIRRLLGQFPVVGVLGARQVGKTTLAGLLAKSFKEPSPDSTSKTLVPSPALSITAIKPLR